MCAAQGFCFLGETAGFWIQTVPLALSAVIAVVVLFSNSRQAKLRATVDLVLHENENAKLQTALEQTRDYRQGRKSAVDLASPARVADPENIHVRTLLNHYEFIASGIKEGAFDEESFKRMQRSSVIQIWKSFSPYVVAKREEGNGTPNMWTELEWLAKRWEASIINPQTSLPRRILNTLGL
jgi:hypothetical protein